MCTLDLCRLHQWKLVLVGEPEDFEFTPACNGTTYSNFWAWVNEYKVIQVSDGNTYTFSATGNAILSNIFLTITDITGTTVYATGVNTLTWTPSANELVRFYSHGAPNCNSAVTGVSSQHIRRIQCGTSCSVNGGILSMSASPQPICVGDGVANTIELSVSGDTGIGQLGLVRAADQQVVELNTSGQFNMENYPAGNYIAGQISVQNLSTLAGVTNLGQLSGCFSLSNGIAIASIPTIGGTLTSVSPTTLCTGNAAVAVTGNTGQNSRFVLLNSDLSTVISQNSTGLFNFNNLPNRVYQAIHLSYANGVSLQAIVPPNLPPCVAASNQVVFTKSSCVGAALFSTPSPANERSVVSFTTPETTRVLLEMYATDGRLVQSLLNQMAEAHVEYNVQVDPAMLPNGLYLYRLTTEAGVVVNKFVVAH